jgi:hypothetical protein
MSNFKYEYTKDPCCLQRLENEIRASSIIISLDYMTLLGITLDIYFKAELSTDDKTTLDALIVAHTGEPMPPEAVLIQLENHDEEGRPYTKDVITEPIWHYSPRSLDFYTSKHESLYNRSHLCDPNNVTTGGTIDGSLDLGDASMHFFDGTNTALTQGAEESDVDFQTRLTGNCTKTVIEFEPHWDYDVIGAKLQIRNPPSDRAYFWFVAAPDIPAEYGGSVVFMGGGMNLHFFSESETFYCDAKTVSRVTYDSVYHSGKVAIVAKHNVGVQIGIQMIYKFYSAH